jgi:hypothetical protein
MVPKHLEKGQALSNLILLTVFVLTAIALLMAFTGGGFEKTVSTTTGTFDRSLSGITGGSITTQTSYRPYAPGVVSPNNGESTNAGVATFSWQANGAADGVDRYKITVQKYVDLKVIGFWVGMGSKEVTCGMGLGCTSTQVSLPFGGSYRWKVRAHNGAGWGNSDGMHYFTAR